MTDCPKHHLPLTARQVDVDRWEEVCAVCEHQEYVKLKADVKALWERLGMPVAGYEVGGISRG